jgi:hypothetical protein
MPYDGVDPWHAREDLLSLTVNAPAGASPSRVPIIGGLHINIQGHLRLASLMR